MYIVPALMAPANYGLIDLEHKEQISRKLVLVTKILFHLLNTSGVEQRENFNLELIQNFIERNRPRLQRFLQDIAEVPSTSDNTSSKRVRISSDASSWALFSLYETLRHNRGQIMNSADPVCTPFSLPPCSGRANILLLTLK